MNHKALSKEKGGVMKTIFSLNSILTKYVLTALCPLLGSVHIPLITHSYKGDAITILVAVASAKSFRRVMGSLTGTSRLV